MLCTIFYIYNCVYTRTHEIDIHRTVYSESSRLLFSSSYISSVFFIFNNSSVSGNISFFTDFDNCGLRLVIYGSEEIRRKCKISSLVILLLLFRVFSLRYCLNSLCFASIASSDNYPIGSRHSVVLFQHHESKFYER